MSISKVKSLILCSTIALFSSALTAKQTSHKTVTADVGVINKERIVYWLKKRGELAKDASPQEVESKLNAFIGNVSPYSTPAIIEKQRKSATKRAKNKDSSWSKAAGVPKTVKVLAIMIDFPDLLNTNHGIQSGDTDMYYASYPVSHYQDLMFKTTEYDGPNGESLMTAYQYYQAESGGEFSFTGQAFGWVTADNNAASYGAHDGDSKDVDTETLIKEAVEKAVAANSIDLNDYDIEDPYDVDGDGILDEADGFIDHVMVFHSSIGEEAGGGNLGEDAIWSHRFFVDPQGTEGPGQGYVIPGTNKSVFGYTVQPIDAAIGVVVHEFGHDLGLPDEYDTGESNKGSPVGSWSVMSGGSWTGNLAGAQPTGFSAYARAYLQENHGANWVNETTLQFDSMATTQDLEIVEAVEHGAGKTNQIRIELPLPRYAPYAGDYQYYSGRGHDLNNTMSFSINVPDSNDVQLTMKAAWNIELDWDFVRVLFNDTSIAGNHTRATNPYTGQYPLYDNATNYISGGSFEVEGAEGVQAWVDLTYDISSFKGQTVTVKFEYKTDSNTGGFGFFADDIRVVSGGTDSFVDNAETAGSVTLAGFSRADDSNLGDPQNYWVQLRSHNGVDDGLPTHGYDKGVLLWFSDTAFSNNQSSAHPGRGLIGVVDADQNMIGTRSSSVQIRDAAFSMFNQSSYNGDSNLIANSVFDDSDDYSAPNQPESGIVLPNHGLRIEVVAQANDSSTATLRISKQAVTTAPEAGFNFILSGTEVTFTNSSSSSNAATYEWNFGDGSAISSLQDPVHDYGSEGVYSVNLVVTDTVTGESDSLTQSVRVGSMPSASFSASASELSVTFSNNSSGGIGDLSYSWTFGDGNTSTDENPVHAYANGGTYTVTLTVTDSTGETSTSSQAVTVTAPSSGGGNNGGSTDSGSSGGGSLGLGLVFLASILFARRRVK